MIQIELETGKWETRKYYKIRYDTDESLDLHNTAERVHELLLDSVRRNMISDVPVGLTFSGGVDTSIILALVKELGMNMDFHTFSVKMDESSYDESYYQRLMADHVEHIHHEIKVGPEDVINNIVSHMAFMDEPNGDGAAIPFYLLAKEAKKYVSVLLSGEGGDEVFNAYETHGAYYLRKLYRKLTPGILRKIIQRSSSLLPADYSKLSMDFLIKRFTGGSEMGIPEAHIFWRHTLTENEKKLLMPDCKEFNRTDKIFRSEFDKLDFPDDLDRISYLDLSYYFIDDLMVKNDRMIMAHSIEARFPMMDRILFEFVSSIPPSMRIRGMGFNRRYIEKKAMSGLVPKEILKRKNMGLEMPHSLWFLEKLSFLADKYFSKKNIEKTGILSFQAVDHMWRQHKAKRKDYGRALWCILMFQIWFDLFIYNNDYKKYLKTTR